jgi:hypothetical protein
MQGMHPNVPVAMLYLRGHSWSHSLSVCFLISVLFLSRSLCLLVSLCLFLSLGLSLCVSVSLCVICQSQLHCYWSCLVALGALLQEGEICFNISLINGFHN